MVRLGIATGSRGLNGEGTGHRGLPPTSPPAPHLYTYPAIRVDEETHHPQRRQQQQPVAVNPSMSSSPFQLRLDSRIETLLPPDTHISPIRVRNESPLPSVSVSPVASSSIVPVPGRSHTSMWERVSRDSAESVIRSQKRLYKETEDVTESKLSKEVKWCPVCRSPVQGGMVHNCPAGSQHSRNLHAYDNFPDKPHNTLNPPDVHISAHPSSSSGFSRHNAPPEQVLNFSGRFPRSRIPVSPVRSHSISPGTSLSQTIPPESHSPILSNSSVLRNSSMPPLEPIDPPLPSPDYVTSPPTSSHMSHPSTSHALHPSTPHDTSSSSERPNRDSSPWSGESYNLPAEEHSEAWETPTSLISRLTARMTARSSQPDDKGYPGCPSPSLSETSSVSMSSSYFTHRESAVAEDPFNMAHQALMDEFPTNTPASANVQQSTGKSNARDQARQQQRKKRGRRCYTTSESASSDLMLGDSSICESQDSDDMDDSCSGYLDENGHLPDIDTLLKSIKDPDLTSYLPDKASIEKFMDPHEIGHINHLIKSVSDAMLTISLPETLYKSKGFTPLDYMDIHLNSIIRHFFFMFKNEDFLNLTMIDQIALLDSCTLRAVQCTSLYLFNKDAGCWHIPGAANKTNQPVIHISDLMQVFPQAFVTRAYELHSVAARLGFDWPMGVLASCVLMYTPLKKIIQEMDKVDLLRNKYVNLLLKYITWKNGTYNASLLFPEVLKLLDALLLHVDDFASITLKLKEDEVMAVEERLATVTMSQISPYGCQSSKFKEKLASWSTLENVKLGDIQNRLCMAMHVSMLESVQSTTNAHYWASNTVGFGSGASLASPKERILGQIKPLPELLPPTDKAFGNEDSPVENGDYLSQKMLQQNRDMKSIGTLAHKDLMMLRKFLEEVTNREGTMVVQNIKEKMDSKQIKKIINKLCS